MLLTLGLLEQLQVAHAPTQVDVRPLLYQQTSGELPDCILVVLVLDLYDALDEQVLPRALVGHLQAFLDCLAGLLVLLQRVQGKSVVVMH